MPIRLILPASNLIGDLLYMYGFWVEYIFVCAYRKAHAVVKGIASTLGNLLMVVLRPVLLGVITFCEDLISPFTRMASGIRHIRELPQELSDAGSDQIRAAKKAYFRSGIRKYYTLLWNAITYVLPAIAAAVLVVVVRNGLGLRFVLNVQVNGESVGYVASEQIFENAREDVQSRINTAKSMLEEAGASVPDTQWEVSPTYSLAVSDDTMTESEIANAILQTASDEIVDGTAVYIDGTLRFVTTEGDHLRTYLESIKAPFENDMDSSIRTGFVHDIRLLDGVYLQESIMSYSDVISALNEGSGVHTYVAEEGDTVQSVVDTTGVTFDSLAQMNPDLQSLDQEIPAGTELLTGASSAELLKVKVVQTETETVAIPFSTEKSESDEYDFGKTVTLQEGVDGLEDVTYEITMIDGEVTDRQAVSYNVLQEPVTQITVTGTKLKNGMVAKLGSGSFVWPVPGYSMSAAGWAMATAARTSAPPTARRFMLPTPAPSSPPAGTTLTATTSRSTMATATRRCTPTCPASWSARVRPSARWTRSARSAPPVTPPATIATLRCTITTSCSARRHYSAACNFCRTLQYFSAYPVPATDFHKYFANVLCPTFQMPQNSV